MLKFSSKGRLFRSNKTAARRQPPRNHQPSHKFNKNEIPYKSNLIGFVSIVADILIKCKKSEIANDSHRKQILRTMHRIIRT